MNLPRSIAALSLATWFSLGLLALLVANHLRWRQGTTVLVLDEARGWGLHRMDLILIAAATLPPLLVALGWVTVRLVRPA